MRLLICGDIVGRRAREAVAAVVPRLRRELRIVTEEREILKKAAAFFAKESATR